MRLSVLGGILFYQVWVQQQNISIMVLFLIPVAVVGYKVWEKRRREEQEEERLKQQSEASHETDSDAASSVALESSISASSTSSPALLAPETSEAEASVSRQYALLRSWKANGARINEQSTCRDTNLPAGAKSSSPQLSLSIANSSSGVDIVEEAASEPKSNALLRSWGARTSEVNRALMEEAQANSIDIDLLAPSSKSNEAEVESSLTRSWSCSVEERAAVVAPLASS